MGTRLVPGLLVALLPLLCVCGGGGGGGGEEPAEPEALMQGTYYVHALSLSTLPPPTVDFRMYPASTWGRCVADGAGGLAMTVARNVIGEYDPGPVDAGVPYTIDENRRFALIIDRAPVIAVFEGGISADGRLATVAKIVDDESPSMFLFARQFGAYSDASLSGAYVICAILDDGVGYAAHGDVSFTGPATGTASLATNVNGAVGAAGTVAVNGSVNARGDTTLAVGAQADLVGGTFAGGDGVVVGGAATDGQPPSLFALVRQSTGRTLADFQGVYFLVGWRWDHVAREYLSATGTLTASGDGSYETLLTVTNGLTLQEDVAGGGTYDLSDAGVFRLTNTLGDVYTGGLSPDGSFGIAGGAINDAHDPAFYFFHR